MVSRQLGIKKVQSSLQVLQVVLGWQGRLSQCGQDITLSSRSNGLVETRQGLYPRSRTWRTTSQGVLEMVREKDLGSLSGAVVPEWRSGCGGCKTVGGAGSGDPHLWFWVYLYILENDFVTSNQIEICQNFLFLFLIKGA